MRLFFALTFDGPSKRRLAAIGSRFTSGRKVAPELLHLTLLFLGEVDHRYLADLQAILPTLSLPPAHFASTKLGVFGRGNASIIWASLEPEEPLVKLHHQIAKEVAQIGLFFDHRPFAPHITLARKVTEPLFILDRPITVKARSIALMHSHQSRGILTYTPVATALL